jgi:hypothetical protein
MRFSKSFRSSSCRFTGQSWFCIRPHQ